MNEALLWINLLRHPRVAILWDSEPINNIKGFTKSFILPFKISELFRVLIYSS